MKNRFDPIRPAEFAAGTAATVVPAGTLSMSCVNPASDGPLFAVSIVHVICEPGETTGGPIFETERSARVVIGVDAVELLFNALLSSSDDRLAVFENVPPLPRFGPTRRTRSNVCVVLPPTIGLVAVTVPVPPNGGAVTVHPAGAVNETNVEFTGRPSVTETFVAANAVVFVRVI